MSAKEKIAWLKGLLSGLEFEDRDAKVYGAVADALEALDTQIDEQNAEIDYLRDQFAKLEEECAVISNDLSDLEYSLDERYDVDAEPDEDNDDEAELYEIESSECELFECPACGRKFTREELTSHDGED